MSRGCYEETAAVEFRLSSHGRRTRAYMLACLRAFVRGVNGQNLIQLSLFPARHASMFTRGWYQFLQLLEQRQMSLNDLNDSGTAAGDRTCQLEIGSPTALYYAVPHAKPCRRKLELISFDLL